ncbi:hypothetical protein Tco_1301269 [Tanacetum coccineum]
MEECHLLLTDEIDLVNPEGNRVVPDVRKPLPLGGPPGQVTIQTQYFFNKDLEYLVSGDKERRNALSISKLKAAYYPDFGLEEFVPSLWIESKREYDISAAYGISHWWFKRKDFYITRHSAPSDRRAVGSHMKILSVVSLKTFSRYGYTFLREIVLRRADYKEYKISEADIKNLHSNDFEDLYLIHLQGKLNHLSGAYKVHLFNAVNLWIRNIVIRKQDCTIVHKPRAVIYKDRNDQKKMMREAEVHKFSDDTLQRILENLDHMVSDYVLFKFNPGMEHRICQNQRDLPRDNPLVSVEVLRNCVNTYAVRITMMIADIEESRHGPVGIEKVAVSSSLRSLKPKRTIESRAKRSSINLIRTLFHYTCSSYTVETMKMEILLEPTSNKLLVGSYKDGDGDTMFQQSQVHYRMLILDRHIQRRHESSSICFKASATLISYVLIEVTKYSS